MKDISRRFKACPSHLPSHGSSSKMSNCNQLLTFFFKHCLIFLPLSKERPVQVCAYIFQERWCAWLQATYHDPKDWLRGIINWKAFQWESFPFISLQEQKEIIGQGIHEMSESLLMNEVGKSWHEVGWFRSKYSYKETATLRINPVLPLWSGVVLWLRVKHKPTLVLKVSEDFIPGNGSPRT